MSPRINCSPCHNTKTCFSEETKLFSLIVNYVDRQIFDLWKTQKTLTLIGDWYMLSSHANRLASQEMDKTTKNCHTEILQKHCKHMQHSICMQEPQFKITTHQIHHTLVGNFLPFCFLIFVNKSPGLKKTLNLHKGLNKYYNFETSWLHLQLGYEFLAKWDWGKQRQMKEAKQRDVNLFFCDSLRFVDIQQWQMKDEVKTFFHSLT